LAHFYWDIICLTMWIRYSKIAHSARFGQNLNVSHH